MTEVLQTMVHKRRPYTPLPLHFPLYSGIAASVKKKIKHLLGSVGHFDAYP
jgi:hypothetical protein